MDVEVEREELQEWKDEKMKLVKVSLLQESSVLDNSWKASSDFDCHLHSTNLIVLGGTRDVHLVERCPVATGLTL